MPQGTEIRLLGLVEAVVDGKVVALGGVKQRALLALLALEVNQRISADRLIEGLWGEHPPASAPKMVQAYVSQLRRLLDGDEAQILTKAGGYELRAPAHVVDAARFERLVAEAAGADGAAGGLARDALSLWRGPALDDVAGEPFAAAAIRHLEDLWLQARELAIDSALAAGGHAAVIGQLEELVAEHPLRERLHAQRMLALYRCGRQADALAAYRHARDVLVEEVGVEPGSELRRLHEAILQQDPKLDAPAGVRSPPAAPPRSHRGRRTLAIVAALAAAAGFAAFGISRLTSPDSLPRIDGDAVGLIDPGDGRITAQYTVGHAPGAIAAGGGSVWVANSRDGTVSRVDRGREQVTTIDVGGEPTAVAYGAGSLWVANGQSRRLLQVDPRTNRVLRRFAVGNGPRAVAVTGDAVWVASSVDGRVDRIDLARVGAARAIDVGGGPAALAAGAGAVWVAGEDSGVVSRLEPRTGAPLKPIPVGNGPAGIAVGAGAVWVTNRDDGTVSRIDPATNAVTDTIRVGGSPVAIAAGEGAIWVADQHGGAVVRIDPESRRVTRRVAVGGSPAALVAADGSIWTAALAARASHRGGTLSYESGPLLCGCVDPTAYDITGWPLITAVYDGLLAYRRVQGAAGSTLVADLATSVPEPLDGGRMYVFQLRPGLRFSNGAPVRARDFRASLERALRLSQGVTVYSGIVGADACTPRRCDLSKGIRTDDGARTITVHLRAPDLEFVHKLALPLAAVVPAGSPMSPATTRPLPGTGPYRIASFDPKRGGRLVRNRYFRSWSEQARPDGFPDEIAVRISEDGRGQAAAVRAGRADAIATSGVYGRLIPIADVRALAVAAASRLHVAPSAEVDYAFLNVREPPFDDLRVRRAVNSAIDRRQVVEQLGGAAMVVPTCQIVPPGLPGYEPLCPSTSDADLARARRLVARSGTRGARVEVFAPPGTDGDSVYRYLTSVLRRLGYRARLRTSRDPAAYYPFVGDSRHRVQIGFTAWSADYLSASTFFDQSFTCRSLLPRSPLNGNLSQFCERAVDSAYDRALATPAGGAANALWAGVDRRVVSAAPAVPLANRRGVVLVSDRVGNVQQHLLLGPLLDQFWVR